MSTSANPSAAPSSKPPLYPVGVILEGRPVLVVGGGPVACEKVEGLLVARAAVTVVSPEVIDQLAELDVVIERRPFRAGDTAGQALVITATNDPGVNRRVADEAQASGIWVNSADDPANCTFTLPSRVRRADLLVTFSTNGRSPALSRWLRRRFEDEFGAEYDVLLDLLADARAELRAEGRTVDAMSWQQALDSGMLEAIRRGRVDDAKETLYACLS